MLYEVILIKLECFCENELNIGKTMALRAKTVYIF